MSLVRGHFRPTPSSYSYRRPRVQRKSSGLGTLVMIGAVAVTIVIAIVRLLVDNWIPVAEVVLGSAVVAGISVASATRQRQRVGTYLELARAVVLGEDAGHDYLTWLGTQISRDDQRRIMGEEEIYATLIAEILADGETDDEECEWLKSIHEVFVFDERRAMEIRQQAFDGFMFWVGAELSERQEAALRELAARLQLSPSHVDHSISLAAEREQKIEAQRTAAYAVFDSDRRTPVDVDVKLERGETCWFVAQASLRGDKASPTGRCLVTDERVLFAAEADLGIKFSRMLDVAADPDSGVLRVVEDGREQAYEFAVEQPLVALAHVERSLREANLARRR